MRGYSMYVVKESGQFSCRGFRCLNVGFFCLLYADVRHTYIVIVSSNDNKIAQQFKMVKL